jgi:hypothetical protein
VNQVSVVHRASKDLKVFQVQLVPQVAALAGLVLQVRRVLKVFKDQSVQQVLRAIGV